MSTKEISEIVNFVITTELEQFKQDYELQPIPKSQDISSLSIAWLCFYCKENISIDNREAITSFVATIMQSKTYSTEGWSRIAALQAASFALTENENHLIALLENLSCHQSGDRTFIAKSISIICPLISFGNEYFQGSVEENLRKRHGGDDNGVIMYLNSNGEDDAKQIWLKEISELENFQSNKVLVDLLAGKSVTDDFFKNTFNEIKSHILFRILKHSYSYNNQTRIFDDNKRVFPKTLNSFQENHPLDKETFVFNMSEV